MADVDLRKLRYFVAVAEQLHFGRAAEALHIAQPVLSRQIRALEDELKVQLLVRDKRSTELTPAGRQLLADAGPLLASADALRRRVVRAARGPGSFTIGFMPGLIVTEAVRALAGRHPQLTVNVLRTNWDDQTDVLHDGRADVSYIRLPVDQSGLQIRALLAEPRVAVLPAGHRLAGKDTITVADLADEHLLQNPDAVPEWRDIATEMRTGRRPGTPVFHTVEEKLEHVAAGHGVVLLPLSTAVFYTRPGVAYSHVSDIPANQVCLAWDATRHSRLIQDFAAIAADHPPIASPDPRLAGRPPEQLLDAPAIALGRAARTAVADRHRDRLLAGWRGRAVVDVALSRSRCADTLADDLLDDHDAFTFLAAQPNLITGPHGMRRFYPDPVDPDVPGPAGHGRSRTSPGQPHRPDPAVHPPSLITRHPATVMRYVPLGWRGTCARTLVGPS